MFKKFFSYSVFLIIFLSFLGFLGFGSLIKYHYEGGHKYKSLRKLVHWSVHPPKFNYPEHIDNDSRIFTAVLYVNPKNNLGTILCKNNSSHAEDHGKPKLLSDYEVEVPWKQNTLFTHNSINGKTWHRYSSSTQRITLNVFFVDPNLILPGRIDTKFLI